MKIWKKILCFIAGVVGVFALTVIVSKVSEVVVEYRKSKMLMGGFEIRSDKENKEKWENIMSDIEGMSVWDKYKAGLAVNNGSDTDGDGLTDKEEIEVYNSDPLKMSSAGDLYTDGYKVSKGMNIEQYYEYTEKIVFPHNYCEEIMLQAEVPTDFNAVVNKIDNNLKLSGAKIYAAYEIYNYAGNVTVNLQDLLDSNYLGMEDIAVYVSDGAEVKKYAYTVNDTSIKLKKKLKLEYEYELYIAEDSLLNDAVVLFGDATKAREVSEEEITGAGLVMTSPILNLFGNPVNIYCEDLYDDEKNGVLEEKVVIQSNAIFEGNVFKQIKGLFRDNEIFNNKNVETQSAIEIDLKYDSLKNALPFWDVTNKTRDEIEFINLFFMYYSYEDRLAYFYNEQKEKQEKATMDFQKHTLPFGNFKSDIGTTGNCAGISHLTAFLYNRGNYNDKGTYTQDGQDIMWDLSLNSENATLMDAELYDYKVTSFVENKALSENYVSSELLSDAEKEFVKMIGSAYLTGNKKANALYQNKYGGLYGNHIYDYSLIEEMQRYLDNNKILDVYLWMNDGTGHTVNIYDYTLDVANENVVWFSVYDSNFPHGDIGEYTLSDTGFKMKVERRIKTVGEGDTFAFYYEPLKDSTYGATSNKAINPTPMLLVLDENWNDINPEAVMQDYTDEFMLGEDNGSFVNGYWDFFDSSVAEEDMTYYLDEEYFDKLVEDLRVKDIIIMTKYRDSIWYGSCYGIACTMGLLYENNIGIFDLTDGDGMTYYEIGKPKDDVKFKNMIQYYQLSQYLTSSDTYWNMSKIYRGNEKEGHMLSDFLRKLEEHTEEEPVVLVYYYLGDEGVAYIGDQKQENEGVYGHAIMAIESWEEDDYYVLSLYDVNGINELQYMKISKDYTSFEFVDANGNVINENSYVGICYRDFDMVHDLFSDGITTDVDDTTIIFSSVSRFILTDEKSRTLLWSEEGLSGDISVNDFNMTVNSGLKEVPSDIIVHTSSSSSYNIKSTGETIDILVSSDEHFYSVEGSNIETITMQDGQIIVDGTDYEFEISIASNTDDSKTELISYSGNGDGKLEVTTEEGRALISAEKEIENLQAFNHESMENYENIKQIEDNQYYVSAGVANGYIRKYWWIGLLSVGGVLGVTVLCIMLRKRNK